MVAWLQEAGLLRSYDKGSWVSTDYSDLDVEVKEAIERLKPLYHVVPKAWVIAHEVGRSPHDPVFKEALFKLGPTVERSNWYHVIDCYFGTSSDSGTPWHPVHEGAEYIHSANECPTPEKYRVRM